MSRPSPVKQALFWVGVLYAAYAYVGVPTLLTPDPYSTWSADGGAFCWHWRAEDGTIARCCRVDTGLWWDAERRPCDGVSPGHGAPEPTR